MVRLGLKILLSFIALLIAPFCLPRSNAGTKGARPTSCAVRENRSAGLARPPARKFLR